MIVSGVHLDHAWVGLGAHFGSALREWSRQILALVVEEANHRSAGMLLIAGDLFDRSYVLPSTVDYASQILGTFSGDLAIVPGQSDWVDGTSLYTTHTWASNTSICTSSDYQSCVAAPAVWVSARTSPGGSVPCVPAAAEPRVLVRAGSIDNGDRVVKVPDLVHDPREPSGFALLINSAQPEEAARRVDLPSQPGSLVELDVTDATNTNALSAACEAALTPGNPLLLRLVGTLAPGVLLPGFSGPDRNLPSEVVLDLDSLSFATPSVDPTDHSARAEFLHAMAYANTPELQRHQTTALGLAALDASVRGA
ncbi:hypothetical protein [Mycolicibacterium monacense]|uniref:hypothetical protein n=1 Tax=Mycolicibacterium monacense TaxID=85693 RepID=UPI001F489FFF|nr:hypothetical protein [Mycolicibacterium monacense]